MEKRGEARLYSLCCYDEKGDRYVAEIQITPRFCGERAYIDHNGHHYWREHIHRKLYAAHLAPHKPDAACDSLLQLLIEEV